MEKIKDFKDLKVWQKSHELALEIYKTTVKFPPEEKFGLVSQMRRASVSIAANIAEGFAKRGKKDKMNFSFKAEGFNIIGDIQLGDNQLVFEGKLPFLAKPSGGIVESISEAPNHSKLWGF